MNNYELEQYLDELGLPNEGKEAIRKARRGSPVRDVRGTGANVMNIFQSAKMGVSIAAESHTVELPAIISYELDSDVLEYYAQPMKLDVAYPDGRWQHIPDFLLLKKDGIIVEEWRQDKRLHNLAKANPERYVPAYGGGWHAPIMEAHFAELGMQYVLSTPEQVNQQKIRNLSFLRAYYLPSCPRASGEAMMELKEFLEKNPIISLQDLVNLTKDMEKHVGVQAIKPLSFSADDIYWAIAHGSLVVDLDNDDLAERHRTHVFRDLAAMEMFNSLPEIPTVHPSGSTGFTLKSGTRIEYEGVDYILTFVGDKNSVISPFNGLVDNSSENPLEMSNTTLLHLYRTGKIEPLNIESTETNKNTEVISPSQVDAAIKRREKIDKNDQGLNAGVSIRTIQRWKKKPMNRRKC
ncbi:hypothetical protein ACL9RI_16250 [Janthinobacterium sp. Mn2066]|uniref:hypothetical protein n=1 Tax=Janthinobacterium sp. Mn2066 TaxID=3395264 RepID=UPI003BE39742